MGQVSFLAWWFCERRAWRWDFTGENFWEMDFRSVPVEGGDGRRPKEKAKSCFHTAHRESWGGSLV